MGKGWGGGGGGGGGGGWLGVDWTGWNGVDGSFNGVGGDATSNQEK